MPQQNSYQFLIPLLVIAPILYVRMRRMGRPRPLKLQYLWVRPALFIVVAALTLLVPQPGAHAVSPLESLGLVVAGALGAVGGWYWGRMMAIEVHPENGTLMAKGGRDVMLVMVLLIALRLGLRAGVAMEGRALHLDVLLITDALLVFTAVLFAARALEMYLRAQRVMEGARNGAA